MIKIKLLFVLIIVIIGYPIIAQVGINSDGSNPDASAILHLKSTAKGILLPRMTHAEILAISNPANALLVFNTTDEKFYAYILADNKWKEWQYGSGEISLPPPYTIGTGSSCANTSVNGTYMVGTALGASNTVYITATVIRTGSWSIMTDTINDYSYSGSGNFAATGTIQLTLVGSGSSVSAQTDNFTATANMGGGTCTFDVIVVPAPYCGTPFNYGGQSYTTVQIGTQCWMAENLNIGTMISGSSSQTDNATIEKYCYDDNASNCDIYGGLYMWKEMMQYVTTEGVQGICPTDWHLPTDAEWCTLENYVDAGTISCSSWQLRGIDAGGNLKETGTTHWYSPNTGATNSSGFTGLPAGSRSTNGSFYSLGSNGNWWTSTESGSSARYRSLMYDNSQVYRFNNSKWGGLSVRCIKD